MLLNTKSSLTHETALDVNRNELKVIPNSRIEFVRIISIVKELKKERVFQYFNS